MFRRKNPLIGSPKSEGAGPAESVQPDTTHAEPHHSRPTYSERGADMTNKPPPPGSYKPEMPPRRVVDIPGSPATRRAGGEQSGTAPDLRKLTVGRDISLSGEITACDVLVVEGTVEAKLRDGHSIEITESGLFRGSVEIHDADIGGRFEGDLLVRGRLRVRSTGRIQGTIKYGELEVEAGGQIIGDVQFTTATPSPALVTKLASPEAMAATSVMSPARSTVDAL